jgi:hypothetical protein
VQISRKAVNGDLVCFSVVRIGIVAIAEHRQRQRQPPPVAVGDVSEQPAAEGTHQEGRGEQHGGIELLHHRIAVRKECRREVQRKRRVGVEIIPFDEIADRTDEYRLDPAPHVGSIDVVACELHNLVCHVCSR